MQSNSTEPKTKFCRDCKQDRPVTEFRTIRLKSGTTFRFSYCRTCHSERQRRHHQTPKGRETYQRHCFKAKYGITLEEYQTLHKLQDGLCRICGKPETRKGSGGQTRLLAVDHCHSTGKIRGLLCASCNSGIGYFKDDPVLLRTALQYLLDHINNHDG